ncbi:hypothetical protein AN958_05650 [Leucoagaricus sp. SymC.cos]|nr:hypothetical protein AN958_05650 [Leucoagaricus sp. SymC.cos]
MSQYLDRRQAQQSYRPKSGLMSPGLQRAREPFRLRNALTGLGLGLFAFVIYSYSISAVKQDVFDDIDEEVKALARTGTSSGTASLPSSSSPSTPSKPPPPVLTKDEEQQIMENAFNAATGLGLGGPTVQSPNSPNPPSTPSQSPARGLLQKLDRRLPGLLDPQNKTLVWGAPPIDNIGKISSSRRS